MVLLVLELWLRRCGKEWGIAGRDVVFARLKEKLSKGDYEAGGCGRGVCYSIYQEAYWRVMSPNPDVSYIVKQPLE